LSNVGLKSNLDLRNSQQVNPYSSTNVRSRIPKNAYHSISKDLLQAKYESQAEELAAREKHGDFAFSLPNRSAFLTSNLKISKRKPGDPAMNPFATS